MILTVVACDGRGCDERVEFSYLAFKLGDLPTIDWSCDIDSEFYYCPRCVTKMVASGELEKGL